MASQRLLWGLAGMIAIFTFKLSDLIAGRYAGRKVNPTKPCFLTPRDAAELQRSMSALGQKRTLKHVHPMSALPPIADWVWVPSDAKIHHIVASSDRL
jgi:hypothetical protein